MMMINLLNPEKKKKRKRKEVLRFMTFVLEFCVIVTSVVAITLLATHAFLQDEVTKITVATNILPGLHSLDQRIRTINRDAQRLFVRQQEYRRWSPLLLTIAETLPKDVRLDSLLLDTKTKKITLTGTARDRTNLLELEKRIATIADLQNISLPFATLLKKESPAWTLTADLAQPTTQP